VEDPERTIVPLLLEEPPLSWRERQAHAVVALSSNSSQNPPQKWQSAINRAKIQLPDMVATGMPVRWNQITVEIIQKWHQLRHHLYPQKNPVKSKSTVPTPISQWRWSRKALSHRRRSKLRRSECYNCISRRSPWANPVL
jgi:hypothetical protein